MRALVGSVAIHIGLIAIAMRPVVDVPASEESVVQPMTLIDVSVASPVAQDDDGGGGGDGANERVAMKLDTPTTRGETRGDVGWAATTLGYESAGDGGDGTGEGTGHGNGHGAGHGLGRSASNGLSLRDLPPPPAPHISKARPAKLLHPTREMDVEEDDLFAAMVTVDATGDVVGARMTKSHPGSRGDAASSSIWQFRYSPALDDDGNPVRSTFVQTFAVR